MDTSGFTVRIYRRCNHCRAFARVGQLPLDSNALLEDLRRQFGGGEYKLKYLDNRGKFLRTLTVDICL